MMADGLQSVQRCPRCAQTWRPRVRHTEIVVVGSTSGTDDLVPRTSLQPPTELMAPDAAFASLIGRADFQQAMDHIHRRGFLVIKLPPHVLAAMAAAEPPLRKFFAQSNAEKNKYRTRQDGETVLSHPGYLTPSPGWAELFEIRKSKRDASYRFPPRCEGPCLALFDALRDLTMRWLAALSTYLCGDARALPKLAAGDTGPATLRAIHYDQVVELGAQLKTIPKSERREASRRLMAGFPAHVDSSLLTLAPSGSCSGLSVRDYATNQWIRIERHLAPDEAVLFCGDPIAYISRHHFPACMHRPDAIEMAKQAPRTRLSTPFFLYADDEATFDQELLRPGLNEAASPANGGTSGKRLKGPENVEVDAGNTDSSTLAAALALRAGGRLDGPATRLTVMDFKQNVGNCREHWLWKPQAYYTGRVLCRDSDAFPGLEAEGVMEYAD